MCGIVGFLSFNKSEGLQKNTLAALGSLRHRGPDATGGWQEKGVWLGHARLSIMDPTAASDQPMISRDKRFVLVYNGEIYNFRELAKEIQVPLQTQSDTEVLLEGIAQYGIGFVKKCNGMFAFAVYDREEQRLWLCRDRMGVKPLFILQKGGALFFASELKAVVKLAAGVQELSLNYEAIKRFLHLGYIPRPATIYNEICKMEQGSITTFSEEGLKKEFFWNLQEQVLSSSKPSSFEEAKQQLDNLLQSAVGYRMISDVPFGSLLSGGIDSSLVTAMAQSQSGISLKTFSVGFEDQKADESKYAQRIADYLGTDHHTLFVNPKDCLEIMEELISLYDEPYADSSAFPTYLVSRFTSKEVKMVISGDGGDELFLGYGMYKWADRLAHPVVRATKSLWPRVLKQLGERYQRAASLFESVRPDNVPSHIFSQEQYFFTSREVHELVNLPGSVELSFAAQLKRTFSPAENQALFDMHYYLPDDLLVKVDRASMANSLEVRPPLLDYRVVAFALNLPESFKRYGKTEKHLLKEVLYQYVPREFFARPKKGFSIPLHLWLRHELKHLLDEYLREEVLRKYEFINVAAVQEVLRSYLGGKTYLYNRVWLLLLLVFWLENHNHATH